MIIALYVLPQPTYPDLQLINFQLLTNSTKGLGTGIKMSALITFMNEFQRDPNMNEMLYPKYDIKRCTEIINDYETIEEKKALSKLNEKSRTSFFLFFINQQNNSAWKDSHAI
jgi:hypothetical protein